VKEEYSETVDGNFSVDKTNKNVEQAEQ